MTRGSMDCHEYPELEAADREGGEAHGLGMSRESNPYIDPPELQYGRQWHWDNGWWREHCEVADREQVRSS